MAERVPDPCVCGTGFTCLATEHALTTAELENEPHVNTYAVCERPSDYPDNIVVRRWVSGQRGVLPDLEPTLVADTVEEAREHLRSLGLVCVGRQPGDDPVIVEVWL